MTSLKKYGSISWLISCLSLIWISTMPLAAQELNAQVQVLSPGIQQTNKRIFTTLETAIRDFLNNRKWTDEIYQPEEKITCSFVINITKWENDYFEGTLQVQYSRPVYKSGYNSPVFVHMDSDFQFNYIEYDRLDFSENTSLSNLTSILGYYAYIIIGLDHDTFEMKGGDPYFVMAQNVVNNNNGGNFPGWSNFSGNNKTRYWLIDNLMNPAFNGIRECFYTYHRQGLDLMHDPAQQKLAKENIKTALLGLKAVNQKRPSSFLMQLFFDAKSTEIINIFSGGTPMNITDLKEVLINIDGNNGNKYEAMGRT